MATPSSGQISISQIKTALGSSSNSLGTLGGQIDKSAPFSMSQFYNYGVNMSGLLLWMDGQNNNSYPGSGTTWTDISGNGRSSTLTSYGGGTPSYSSLGGGAIQFFRGASYNSSAAVFSTSLGGTTWADLTSAVTLSVWFYTGTSNVMILAGKGFRTSPTPAEYQAYQFYTNGSSIIARVTAGGATNNTDVSTTFSFNTWTNIVLTYDGSTIIVYKNGSSANSASKSGSITNSLSIPFVIGAQFNANSGTNYPTDGFDGYIGQVLLYNRALSSSEVSANFSSTRSRFGV